MDRLDFNKKALAIAEVGRFLAAKNWSPATSSNYSTRLDSNTLAVTRSGVDKHQISETDILVTDMNGTVIEPSGGIASAETLIHTTIYRERPQAQAVLHTHSTLGTRLSLKFKDERKILISGYELLKGLAGNTTHKMTENIPILDNNQNMSQFSDALVPVLQENQSIHGFLIAGHGLYSWGTDLQEARRHIETYEFLFECLESELNGI